METMNYQTDELSVNRLIIIQFATAFYPKQVQVKFIEVTK